MKVSGTIVLFSIAFFPIKVTDKFPRVASAFSEISFNEDASKRIGTTPLETIGDAFSKTVDRLYKALKHDCLVSKHVSVSKMCLSNGRKSNEARGN